MSATSTQIIANQRALRLFGSTVVCGISLAFALGGAFQTSIVDELGKNRPLRSVELSVLNPILKLERPRFFRAPVAPVVAEPAVIVDAVPVAARATTRKSYALIARAVVAKARPAKINSVEHFFKAKVAHAVVKHPLRAPKRSLAPAVSAAISAAAPVNPKSHWKEILEIAEYITGDNLGMKAPAPLEHRGVLIAEVTSMKAIEVIDGGPSLEDAAWLALVADADRIEKLAAVLPKSKVVAQRNQPKAAKKADTVASASAPAAQRPLVHIIEATPAEKAPAEAVAAPVAMNSLPAVDADKVRDQVTNLVGAVSRDQVVTERMGIQEDAAKGDASASDVVLLAKSVLNEELPAEKKEAAAPAAAITVAANELPVGTNPMKRAGTSKEVEITGKLANEARGYPGHFEVGFYKAVSPEGVPIGAPLVQDILKNKQLSFRLNTPRAAQGYLFARFISADAGFKAKEWHGYPTALDLREVRGTQVLLTIPMNKMTGAVPALQIAAISKHEEATLKGKVGAMFAPKGSFLPLEETKVRLRGTKYETTSDKAGGYSLKIPNAKGRALVEFIKPGYMPRVIEIALNGKGGEIAVPEATIASREAVRHMAHSLGIHQNDDSSVLILEAKGRQSDAGLPGISAQMTLKAEGPFYFSEKAFPQRELKGTTTDGRMIFFNVEPGVGFLETFILGESVTPFAVAPLGNGEAMVQTIEFLEGETKITGKIFDPIASRSGNPLPINGAKVRVAGGAEWTETDSFGSFELPNFKFVRGTEILIEVMKNGYYNHRFQYRVPMDKADLRELQLFAFPQEYINRLSTSVEIQLDPNLGMLMGKVGGTEGMRIDALLDHSGDNGAKDYYFDAKNVIQGSHALTHPGFGTYMIFDVSPGRVLLQGHNQAGEMRYSEITYFSPSTINVIIAD